MSDLFLSTFHQGKGVCHGGNIQKKCAASNSNRDCKDQLTSGRNRETKRKTNYVSKYASSYLFVLFFRFRFQNFCGDKIMDEYSLKNWMIQNNLTVKQGTLEDKLKVLKQVVDFVLQPRNISDRTCFRNVYAWIKRKILEGQFGEDYIFPIIIDNILEASNPDVRNPRAVFMHILKTEYNYPN